MAQQIYGDRDIERAPLRGVVAIMLIGAVLGFVYNYLGLRNETWGVSWIAEDRAEIPALEDLGGSPPASSGYVSDDPMAVPASPAAAGLPEIPDLGRPIQMQLSAVKKFFDADAALIIDAREPGEYDEGHIAGAVNLPYDEVITDPARLESLDSAGRPLITYCGGGTCELSLSLAHALNNAGHRKVLVFMGGYPEWESAGYPLGRGHEVSR